VVTTPPGGRRTAGPVSIEIIVPAHNEARRLPAGLASLCRKAAQLPLPAGVLVVDSASSDGTADVVRDWPEGPVPVRLLRSDQPGKGRAVRLGLLATRAPFVGFCDADMATDLSALDVTIGLLTAGQPLVIGSRAVDGSVVEERHSAVRRLGAAAFRALARRVLPDATDTQCGFKFFSGPLARAAALPLRTGGFAFDIELIAICQRLGAPPTEIPVSWRDVPGSTFSVSHHSAATLREVALIWLHYRPGRARPAGLPAPLTTGLAAEPFGPASVIVLPFTPPALLASSAALPAAVTTA
jgi:glycosyltransferase involved in cell wall biosynthesis